MHPALRVLAESVKGFMPPDEGLALFDAALEAGGAVPGAPFVEIGSYCGKSSVYIGEAARQRETVLFAVDHHRGSEENQSGWEHHDTALLDETGRLDTLPFFRRTIREAGLEGSVVAVVSDSPTFAAYFSTPCAFVFIDGGHGAEPAHADYEAWSRRVALGGTLTIHDVFPDPADGGRPPFEIYQRALGDGFREIGATGSLRVLLRTRP